VPQLSSGIIVKKYVSAYYFIVGIWYEYIQKTMK